MNDITGDKFFQRLEVGDLERADRIDGQRERLVGAAPRGRIPQPLPCGAKGTEHLRPVEPLSLAVIAETHNAKFYQIGRPLHNARRPAAC